MKSGVYSIVALHRGASPDSEMHIGCSQAAALFSAPKIMYQRY